MLKNVTGFQFSKRQFKRKKITALVMTVLVVNQLSENTLLAATHITNEDCRLGCNINQSGETINIELSDTDINDSVSLTIEGQGSKGSIDLKNVNLNGDIYLRMVDLDEDAGDVAITTEGGTIGESYFGIKVIRRSNNNLVIDNHSDISASVTGISVTSAESNGEIIIKSSGEITNSSIGIEVNYVGANASSGNGKIIIDNRSNYTASSQSSYQDSFYGIKTSSKTMGSTHITNGGILDVSKGDLGAAIQVSGIDLHIINTQDGKLIGPSDTYSEYSGSVEGAAIIVDEFSDDFIMPFALSGRQISFQLDNQGEITSGNDITLHIKERASVQYTINNDNFMEGKISIDDNVEISSFTVNNRGIDSLRHFSKDENGDLTKRVAISDFGTDEEGNAAGIYNNIGGTLTLGKVSNPDLIDTTNQYLPIHPNATESDTGYSIENDNVLQGQLHHVKEFNHAGIIDLTAGGESIGRNILVITGGDQAGIDGGGRFVTNGGSIHFNAVINDDGTGYSDRLIVDNVENGGEATLLSVTIISNNVGTEIKGNGIQLVEVMGNQENSAFELDAPVTRGMYEYVLGYGPTGNNGYYLTSQIINSEDEEGENTTKPPRPEDNNTILNPELGVLLGVQHASLNLFSQKPRERYFKGDVRVWATINGGVYQYRLFDDRQSIKTKDYSLQIGGDFYLNEDKSAVAGAYVGWGQSDIKSTSNQTGTQSKADVTGYSVGVYGYLNHLKNKGVYFNSWVYFARFHNKLKGTSFNTRYREHKTYQSHLFSANTELGYRLSIYSQQVLTVTLQPQIGLSYNDYSGKDFIDSTHSLFSGNKFEGVQTAIGARIYATYKSDRFTIKPYAELNWLYNGGEHQLTVNGPPLNQTIKRNAYQFKVGINSHIHRSLAIYGELSGLMGRQHYRQYQAQFGIEYLF